MEETQRVCAECDQVEIPEEEEYQVVEKRLLCKDCAEFLVEDTKE